MIFFDIQNHSDNNYIKIIEFHKFNEEIQLKKVIYFSYYQLISQKSSFIIKLFQNI